MNAWDIKREAAIPMWQARIKECRSSELTVKEVVRSKRNRSTDILQMGIIVSGKGESMCNERNGNAGGKTLHDTDQSRIAANNGRRTE